MTTAPRGGHPFHARIIDKLAEVAAASPTPPSWYPACLRLGPRSTAQERLAVYRAIRDAGSVPEEASFFLIAWPLDQIADRRADDRLRQSDEHLKGVCQQYGLGEDLSANSDGPPAEYREATRQVREAWDALYADTLDEYGESDIARLFRENPEQFAARYERGRQFFQGPGDGDREGDEDWLDLLLEAVSGCVEAESPMGPLGLRYQVDDGFWELSVYPTPVELVGGAHDGEVVLPGFRLDLEQLRSLFDTVSDFGWNALGLVDPEGPYVYVEGVLWGREVFLQVLASPPEDEEPGLKIDATRRHRQHESGESDPLE
jgi:hypothetical protein